MDESAAPSEFEQRRLAHVFRTAEYIRLVGARRHEPLEPPQRLKRSQLQDEQAEEADIVESSRTWLRQSRAALLSPGLGGSPPGTAEDWRQEAVQRWGDGVPAAGTSIDWEVYVKSRLPSPPPASPLDIMQERYAYDAWRLLAACALMTRISSERVKEETIAQFFLASPTPSAFLASLAAPESEALVKLKQLLRPLGMVDSRVKTLTELSQSFLSMPAFDCGEKKGVNKIWGCGPFSVDSYLIFCRGKQLLETNDASCQAYLDWWRTCNEKQEQSCVGQQLLPEDSRRSEHACLASHTGAEKRELNESKGLHRFFKIAKANG
eukprot:TRINITY_DN12374_c1_g1_i1.p1 TRINITY_DN12374_c1_g1~~TRINITY_DN12374_c1_g1_i1.p1  ORF type:complete len:322 (-),score=74.53 TRINITY_DN12374_c1_g1_i1:73-1038(-)